MGRSESGAEEVGLEEQLEGARILDPLKEKAGWSIEQGGDFLRGSHCSAACAFGF